jgi:hypothetical protein
MEVSDLTLGQQKAMANLAFGYHLNANSDDFSGAGVDGTDYNMSYDAPSGILGPAALFNGTTSRVYLGITEYYNLLQKLTFSICALVRPATGFGNFPIISRGLVSDGGDYYGCDFGFSTTGIAFTRNQGNTTNYIRTASFTFNALTTYLVGMTYNQSNGAVVFYIFPLQPAGASLIVAATAVGTGTCYTTAPYDQYWNLGARLRNVSNQYCKGSINEFLVFNDVRTTKWFMMYAQQLRGLLD